LLVLGLETATPQTSVALGSEVGVHASLEVARGMPGDRVLMPAVEDLLRMTGTTLGQVGGIAVDVGPGQFTGMRVGIAAARTLAQSLGLPMVGLASLDVLAFGARYTRRVICGAIDAKRGEVFFAFYRPVPGGVARQTDFEVAPPLSLAAELEARPEDILLVGSGALVHRRALEPAGSHLEFASAAHAYPRAASLVELAVPRFQREDTRRPYDVRPLYLRRSDAELAWERRNR